MTDSGVVLVDNAYAQSRSEASMIRHLLCGMLCAALLLLPAAGRANPGDLDPTFGIGGKIVARRGVRDGGEEGDGGREDGRGRLRSRDPGRREARGGGRNEQRYQL